MSILEFRVIVPLTVNFPRLHVVIKARAVIKSVLSTIYYIHHFCQGSACILSAFGRHGCGHSCIACSSAGDHLKILHGPVYFPPLYYIEV